MGTPPNPLVLRALADEPGGLAELQGHVGCPGSTLRARLRELADAGVVAPREEGRLPRRSVRYELTVAGEELLEVVDVLDRWLAASPEVSRPFGEERAKAAIRALAEAWSATLLRVLAVRPISIADLDSVVKELNYPSLERRIAAMRLAGQVKALPVNGRETPYAATAWLRRSVAPLLAAIRWERRHLDGAAAAVSPLDVEALLLLATPLVELADETSGGCRLAVEVPAGNGRRLAGVLVDLESGRLAGCSSRLDGEADAWASGPLTGWFGALIDRDATRLEIGGDGKLAGAVISGLHEALFSPPSLLEDLGEPALQGG